MKFMANKMKRHLAILNELKNSTPGENRVLGRGGISKWKREVQASLGVRDSVESTEQQCHWQASISRKHPQNSAELKPFSRILLQALPPSPLALGIVTDNSLDI